MTDTNYNTSLRRSSAPPLLTDEMPDSFIFGNSQAIPAAPIFLDEATIRHYSHGIGAEVLTENDLPRFNAALAEFGHPPVAFVRDRHGMIV